MTEQDREKGKALVSENIEKPESKTFSSCVFKPSIKGDSVIHEKETVTASKPETTLEHQHPTETEMVTSKPATTVTNVPKAETTTRPERKPTYATAKDETDISTFIIKYINEYRADQETAAAIQLPRLTEYAEYHSIQLVSNFVHDTRDVCAAATALQNGEYVYPSVYGIADEYITMPAQVRRSLLPANLYR